jgi:hypothetical protein
MHPHQHPTYLLPAHSILLPNLEGVDVEHRILRRQARCAEGGLNLSTLGIIGSEDLGEEKAGGESELSKIIIDIVGVFRDRMPRICQ